MRGIESNDRFQPIRSFRNLAATDEDLRDLEADFGIVRLGLQSFGQFAHLLQVDFDRFEFLLGFGGALFVAEPLQTDKQLIIRFILFGRQPHGSFQLFAGILVAPVVQIESSEFEPHDMVIGVANRQFAKQLPRLLPASARSIRLGQSQIDGVRRGRLGLQLLKQLGRFRGLPLLAQDLSEFEFGL